jgi:hypothetical protein
MRGFCFAGGGSSGFLLLHHSFYLSVSRPTNDDELELTNG